MILNKMNIKDFIKYCKEGNYIKGDDKEKAPLMYPGVSIGENSIIGTGSIVTKDIPANSIAVGVLAKVIKNINS